VFVDHDNKLKLLTSRLYNTWNTVRPGVEVFSMFLSVSRALLAVGRGKVPLPIDVKDVVDDDPLRVDDPVLVVGDVPRDPAGGFWDVE